jgi:hypothetical protein
MTTLGNDSMESVVDAACIHELWIDVYDLTGLERGESSENFGQQGNRMMQLRAGSMQDNHGYVILGHILLKAHVAVACDENIELFFRQSQQCAILNSTPAFLLRRNSVMAGQRA